MKEVSKSPLEVSRDKIKKNVIKYHEDGLYGNICAHRRV